MQLLKLLCSFCAPAQEVLLTDLQHVELSDIEQKLTLCIAGVYL